MSNLLSKIEIILLKADLEGLIKMGTPEDEYNNEALLIFNQINKSEADTTEEIAKIIYDVFVNQFGGNNKTKINFIKNRPVNKYYSVANEILEAIEDNEEMKEEFEEFKDNYANDYREEYIKCIKSGNWNRAVQLKEIILCLEAAPLKNLQLFISSVSLPFMFATYKIMAKVGTVFSGRPST